MTLTPEEGRRLHVLTLLEGKRISLGQAAEALGLTPRQVRRLRVGLRHEGPAALIHGNRGRRSIPASSERGDADEGSPPRAPSGWRGVGQDIFTEQLGGHFH